MKKVVLVLHSLLCLSFTLLCFLLISCSSLPSPVLGSPSAESPVHPRPSTPSRLALFIRQQSSGGGGSASSPTGADPAPSSPRGGQATTAPLSPDSPLHQASGSADVPDGETGYLEYLRDARRGIELCSWACRDWSAPYDGEDPSPNLAPAPPPPPTSHPSLSLVPEHFSLQGGLTGAASAASAAAGIGTGAGLGSAPGSGEVGQKERAAVVAAARSEWSCSERDSGEWDVTISKNCISLTPRSKKRSLQRDQMPLNVAPLHLPPSSSSSSSSSTSASSAATTMPTSTVSTSSTTAVPHQALFNGTGRGDGCPDLADGAMEVKKVKRDVDASVSTSGPELGQNGAVGMCTPEACLPLQGGGSSSSGGYVDDARGVGPASPQQMPPQVSCQPQPAGPPLSCPASEGQAPDEGPKPTPSPPQAPPDTSLSASASSSSSGPSRGLESVESLIEELLERAPTAAAPQAGDSNGQGISIEAFHQELRELEERVRERRAAAQALEELAREPPAHEHTEDELQPPPTPLESELGAGEAKTDAAAGGMFSPARPLGQPAAPPYTGKPDLQRVSSITQPMWLRLPLKAGALCQSSPN